MPRYVDGFLLPIKKTKLAQYRRIAARAGRIWREHGALDYKECVGDDLQHEGMFVFFPDVIKTKKDETVVFSYIVYKSRAHRDRVNAKVMADPRMGKMMKDKDPPLDYRRMAFGGFRVIVDR